LKNAKRKTSSNLSIHTIRFTIHTNKKSVQIRQSVLSVLQFVP
jgi:hypothetical protein